MPLENAQIFLQKTMTYNQYQEVNTTYLNTLLLIMYIIRKVTLRIENILLNIEVLWVS